MGNFTSNALASAHKALKNADNFGQRETGNKKAGDRPSYSMVRDARKAGSSSEAPAADNREFMGVRANEGSELNTALASRADAQKALSQ